MAICRTCGLALLPGDGRCPKCGQTVAASLPKSASAAAMQKAVQAVVDPAAPATPTTPGMPPARMAAVGVIVCALVLLFTWVWLKHEQQDAAEYFPLVSGRSWLFLDLKSPGTKIRGTLGSQQTFDGETAWTLDVADVEEAGERPMGQGFLELHFRGFDLAGVNTNPIGQFVLNMRMASFPMSAGKTWTWERREGFSQADSTGSFTVVSNNETQQVPMATYPGTTHVRGVVSIGSINRLQVDYWLARGVGPVRFDMDIQNPAYGIVSRQLVLESCRQ